MSEYDRWQARFSVPDYVFGTAPNAFLAAQKRFLPKCGRALAVADGEGRNGVWLAEQGLDVLSIDFSPAAQAKARALAQRRGVGLKTELVDIDKFPWPEAAFDVVIDIFTQFSTPEERGRKFAGERRALKPGGLLLIQGYRPEQIAYGTGGPKEADHMYTRALLEREFGDFEKVRIDEYDVDIREGTAHGGMSAVIDLIGWKRTRALS
jgi:SAM-dependent methyltransferase